MGEPRELVIKPQRSCFDVDWRELLRYRDLLWLFIRRDFVAFYKQTVLGPLWFVMQPVLTTVMFTLVFGNLAGLSTDGLPKLLFYLSGVTLWSFFAENLTKSASTFTDNANLFGKVYFPRLISPLALLASNFLKFAIQLALFAVIWGFYWASGAVAPNWAALLLPVLILIISAISLGLGLIFSAITTKYRDLRFLLQFGVQLFMYMTPIIFPVSAIPEKYTVLIELNPLTPVVEAFRFGLLGSGSFSIAGLAYAAAFGLGILFFGGLIFNKVETTFMDTV